jgi:hypothetical protein
LRHKTDADELLDAEHNKHRVSGLLLEHFGGSAFGITFPKGHLGEVLLVLAKKRYGAMCFLEFLKLGKPDLKLSSGALTSCPLKFDSIQGTYTMIRQ